MATSAQKRIKSVSYAKYGYIFTAPFFIVYFIFMLWPLIQTFILAFYGNGSPTKVSTPTTIDDFMGFANFKTILFGARSTSFKEIAINEEFVLCFKNTVLIWVGNFIPQICLSLLLAVWFTDLRVKMPGKGFFKVVMYMPNIITAASVAGLFLSLFGDSEYSVANMLLMEWGILEENFKFISTDISSRILVMFIQVWMWFGNTMIMLMSGIQGINESLFEAAEIDGANSRQTFWKVTFPLLKSIMVYTLLTSMIGGLQMFDIPYMLHTGFTLNDYIKTVAVFIYEKFHKDYMSPSYGYSAAASVILFVITAILGALVFYVQRDKDAIEIQKKRKAAMKEYKRKMARGGGLGL
ncbi:MAG: sugar ABC transporter permease [Oscillospiraceae bacterium]|nr:sugar ABC transporter permease [Oscillospiraceae bacterium]